MRAPPESFKPTTGAPTFHGQIHHFADLAALAHSSEPRTREVLGKGVGHAAVDSSIAGSPPHRPECAARPCQSHATVLDELVNFLEASFIEKAG